MSHSQTSKVDEIMDKFCTVIEEVAGLGEEEGEGLTRSEWMSLKTQVDALLLSRAIGAMSKSGDDCLEDI